MLITLIFSNYNQWWYWIQIDPQILLSQTKRSRMRRKCRVWK